MTQREFNLLVFYMKARGAVAFLLATLLAATIGVLVFVLRTPETNGTLAAILGTGIGTIGTGLTVVVAAISRDITEYLKDSRQMPERADAP